MALIFVVTQTLTNVVIDLHYQAKRDTCLSIIFCERGMFPLQPHPGDFTIYVLGVKVSQLTEKCTYQNGHIPLLDLNICK